ncbi:MAG TPA: DUF3108 domain-containing protein, partial [Longimicrobium sp.]|nr:DUF3108 domain-containing protein [Longimicrobium sp.]
MRALRSLARPAAAAALAAACLLPALRPAATQGAGAPLPFAVGEEMVFRARSSRWGTVGTGSMRVEPAETVRGASAWKLHFHFGGRVGPARVEDCTASWLVPERMASLRYHHYERAPLSRRTEEVEMFPAERRWTGRNGQGGRSATDAPLDELSFLYYVRTLRLEPGAEYTLNRHFDPNRNPVHVRVLRRERQTVPAGTFSVVVVEMRVRDPRVGDQGGG